MVQCGNVAMLQVDAEQVPLKHQAEPADAVLHRHSSGHDAKVIGVLVSSTHLCKSLSATVFAGLWHGS